MSLRTSVAALVGALLCTAAPALAQDNNTPPPAVTFREEKSIPRIDLGLSGGINNPGGIYGIEGSFRILDYLSVGAAGGNGAWGVRLSPLVRAYPFGASRLGLFVETGASLNLGGSFESRSNGQLIQRVDLLFTPVIDAAVGWRFQISKYGFIAVRAGYGFKLGGDNNYRVSEGPEEVDAISKGIISLSQPGGIMAGLSGGVAFF